MLGLCGFFFLWKPAVDDPVGDGGAKFTARTAQLEKNKNGKFMFDNQALKIDEDVDPRLKRPKA